MILTVTLNPALDKLVAAGELRVGETNRVELLSTHAAGKGVDVAKVLRDLREEVCATGFLGGPVSSIFADCFEQEGIGNAFVDIEGCTRTNLQIFGARGQRTELLEKGPAVTSEEWNRLLAVLDKKLPAASACAVCGSAPGDVTPAMARDLVRKALACVPVTVVDMSGPLLAAAVEEKPCLIKPNRAEMCELMGVSSATEEELIAYARALVTGGVAYVLVSLSKEGALLVCREGVWRAKAPDVPVKSTLGCGDTMVASLLLSITREASPGEMLRRAVALSSANAMTFETAHIRTEDYESLLPLCAVEQRI